MTVAYKAVGWNPQKKAYDRAIALGLVLYLGSFIGVGIAVHPEATAETLLIRALGTGAILLLHVVLAIGPLCRIDARFLPLLYNRRHLGVATFLLGLLHGGFSLVQFHALGDLNPFVSLFVANTRFDSLAQFPFHPLGALALVILFLMAATSHDFWLANLSAPVWKALHMLVYVAYVLLIGHVALGVLQAETSSIWSGLLILGPVVIFGLHGIAALRGAGVDRAQPSAEANDGFIEVCRVGDIRANRARIVSVSGERVAIFKYDGRLSALSNVCQHQNGPLGEGRVIDGCVTCPWHGYQYSPASGASPAPFHETVPTFRLRLEGDRIWIDPRPLPAGTPVEPVLIAPSSGARP